MSHNTSKVNSQTPTITGAISQSLNDLNDVSLTSVSDGQFVQYDNSSSLWKNVAAPAGSFAYLTFGQGETDAYSNSGAGTTIGAGDRLRFYDSSVVNTLTGSSVTKYSGTNWIEYCTVPAGKYLFCVTYRAELSATGYLAYKLYSGTTEISSLAVIGDDVSTYDNAAGYIMSYYEFGSSSNVELKAVAVSNVDTVANQGNTPAQYSNALIIKVG